LDKTEKEGRSTPCRVLMVAGLLCGINNDDNEDKEEEEEEEEEDEERRCAGWLGTWQTCGCLYECCTLHVMRSV
jgi:hypothetical protein